MTNFRPVSHLLYVFKSSRISFDVIDRNSMIEKFQSAYRLHHYTTTPLHHSTESDWVFNDFTVNLDHGMRTRLALLDILAAFDTIDNDNILRYLSDYLGFVDNALKFMKSYLSDRT